MRVPRSKKFLALLASAIVAGSVTAVAIPAVISQQIVSDTTNVHLRVVRTAADGFDSGWHVHPGLAIVQVLEGSVQITQGSCTAKTLGAGETYIEVPHSPVRAVAPGRFVWSTTFILSGGYPVQIPWATYSAGNPNPCP